MIARRVLFALVSSLCLVLPARAQSGGPIEPNAGNWKPWVISAGKDFRVPPPPGAAETRHELKALADLVQHNDAAIQQQIAFWDAGAPSYRWMDLINQRALNGPALPAFPHRVYAYVAMAMNDATIAAWDSKYYYNRPRPSQMDHNLATAAAVPNSPSYPSEHSATAWAAATVLAHLMPADSAAFLAMADQAGKSRVLAGLQFPSDDDAGAELGRRVAAEVIKQADADGSATPAIAQVPSGACNWKGTNPGNFGAQNWTPILLSSPNQFRPPVPPDCSTAQVQQELADVRNFPRDLTTPAAFNTNYRAFYWQSPDGLTVWPYRYADKWMAEDGTQLNPPRAARVYALIAASFFDAFIASQDGKFTYWYIRPSQLDTNIKPLFPVPPFPSYPSNHSTFSATRSEVLAYLFPAHATFIRGVGKEGGDSRIWAGIHYQMDNVSGVNLGRSVAGVFIARAQQDGSQ
jgi:membrane-associated phospholipid phosphatase